MKSVTHVAGLFCYPCRRLDTGWAGQQGEVMVQGERWRARAAGPLRSGQVIRVVGRDGLTLLVEPA